MRTKFSNSTKTAKDIYWNVVNLMKVEYRDVLVDLKKREDDNVYSGYPGYIQLLAKRETILEEVRTKLGISDGLVYGLDHELVSTATILEMAERYVSSSFNNKESVRANQIFWYAVNIIDREYGDYLRLLDEHLDVLEMVDIHEYNTWGKWWEFKRNLTAEIIKKFNNEHNLTIPNEIIVDEYGMEWDYESLIHHAINHIGSYIPWEERIRYKEKEEGAVDWDEEYRFYVTPH